MRPAVAAVEEALERCRQEARRAGLAVLELTPGPALLLHPPQVPPTRYREALAGPPARPPADGDCQVSVAERRALFTFFAAEGE